jgi:hypothetical protein
LKYKFSWEARAYFSRTIEAEDASAAYRAFLEQRRRYYTNYRMLSVRDENGVEHWDRIRECLKGYKRLRLDDIMVKALRKKKLPPERTAAKGEIVRHSRTGERLKKYVDLGEAIVAMSDLVEARERFVEGGKKYMTFEQCLAFFQKRPNGGIWRDGPGCYEIVKDLDDGHSTVGFTSPVTFQALKEAAHVGASCYGGFKPRRAIYPYTPPGVEAKPATVPLWKRHALRAAALGKATGLPADLFL